jgi:hypothetical protein
MDDSVDQTNQLEQWRSIPAAANADEATAGGEDDERAATIVAQWREFLPADCVETMIKHGWHRQD